MTAALHPESAIMRRYFCISIESGVVLSVFITLLPITTPIVPIMPVFIPPACMIERIIYEVVVFPFVPVMPTVTISFAGWPYHAAATDAIAARVSFTITTGMLPHLTGSCAKIAAAPASAALPANLWLSTEEPQRHINRLPGFTLRESETISFICTSTGLLQLYCRPARSSLSNIS